MVQIYPYCIIRADGYSCVHPLWILSPSTSPDEQFRGFLQKKQVIVIVALRSKDPASWACNRSFFCSTNCATYCSNKQIQGGYRRSEHVVPETNTDMWWMTDNRRREDCSLSILGCGSIQQQKETLIRKRTRIEVVTMWWKSFNMSLNHCSFVFFFIVKTVLFSMTT